MSRTSARRASAACSSGSGIIISTTGLLPEFGDGFFHLERDSFDFLYLCEYAAEGFR